MALLAAVIALFAQSFVAGTASSGYAQFKEVAVTLANTAIDNQRAVNPASSLLTGTCITSSTTQVYLSATYCSSALSSGAYEQTPTTTTLDSKVFTTTVFVGNCYLQSSGQCTLSTQNSEPMIRVIAQVSWPASTGCTGGICYYVASSLISNGSDSILNTVLPGVPVSFSATAGNAQVTLNWSAPAAGSGSPVTGYDAYEGTTSGGENTTTPACTTTSTVTTCTITGLTNGTTYYFTVEAANAAGNSAASTEASTVPYTVPGNPTNLTASAGNAVATLNWTDPSSNGGSVITGYNVLVATTSGNEVSGGVVACTASGATATSCTASGLTHTTYYFEVQAVNAAGNSSASNEASALPTIAVVTLSPSSGNVGTTVTISGTGFTANATISHSGGVVFAGTAVSIGSSNIRVASNGTWSATFTVPNASSGAEGVTATDSSSVSATATFTVTANLTVSTSSGGVGTSVTVSGTGYTGGGLINHSTGVTFNGTAVSIGSSNASISSTGTWSATFTVPNSSYGSKVVSATDSSGASDTATFSVVATITLSPTTGRRSTTVTISGTGFTSGATINRSSGVTFNGTAVSIGSSNITVASNGTWTATFTVPSNASYTTQTVKATDSSGASDTATYTVTS
jgi:hypothetical protein